MSGCFVLRRQADGPPPSYDEAVGNPARNANANNAADQGNQFAAMANRAQRPQPAAPSRVTMDGVGRAVKTGIDGVGTGVRNTAKGVTAGVCLAVCVPTYAVSRGVSWTVQKTGQVAHGVVCGPCRTDKSYSEVLAAACHPNPAKYYYFHSSRKRNHNSYLKDMGCMSFLDKPRDLCPGSRESISDFAKGTVIAATCKG